MIPVILGLFGALFFFGRAEVRNFEHAAAREISSKLQGDHRQVSVQVRLSGLISGPLGDLDRATIRASHFSTPGLPFFTEPNRSQKGIVRELDIDLRDFTLATLHVRELSAKIPDCRYDYALALSKRQIRLSRSGMGRGYVVIEPKDLEAFILAKFKEIKRVSVRVYDDRVLVEGYGEFLFIRTNFSVVAKLVAVDGTRLSLEDATILFDGRSADAESRRVLLETLNPVVDLDRDLGLCGAIKVDRITLRDGLLRAEGATQIPVRPALSPPTLGRVGDMGTDRHASFPAGRIEAGKRRS